MALTLARKILKVIFFIIISLIVGRTLSSPETYINYNLANEVAEIISGNTSADSLYDAYFYIDVVSVVAITTVIYILIMKLIKKTRKK